MGQQAPKNVLDQALGIRAVRLPPLVASFVVASLFFKLGSFALECVCFLVLWRVLDALYGLVVKPRPTD